LENKAAKYFALFKGNSRPKSILRRKVSRTIGKLKNYE